LHVERASWRQTLPSVRAAEIGDVEDLTDERSGLRVEKGALRTRRPGSRSAMGLGCPPR
jgi:hypothetical protein